MCDRGAEGTAGSATADTLSHLTGSRCQTIHYKHEIRPRPRAGRSNALTASPTVLRNEGITEADMSVARGIVRQLEASRGGGMHVTNYVHQDGSHSHSTWAKSRMVFPLIEV